MILVSASAFAAGPNSELRGAWVTAWNNGFLSPQEADETIRLAKEAGFNTLFIQARKVADAYYKSNIEPRASNITGGADYDPLRYVLKKANAQGIQVHAWVNVCRVWTTQELPSNPKHVVNLHPDWLTRTANGSTRADEGLYLDPGVPGAQDYIVSVVVDLVKNYDVDGIHLDYIRYPGSEFGYAPASVEAFNRAKGRKGIPSNNDPAWQQWRRDQVTELVKRIYKTMNSLNPRVKVTAATTPWGDCQGDFCDTSPFTRVYQDWQRWMSEGIIDANVPMNYKDESSARYAREYRNWLDGFRKWQYGRHVYVGINIAQSPDLVVRQMEAARKSGAHGLVGFQFNESPARPKLVQALKNSAYSQIASVPAMPWKTDDGYRKLYAQAIQAATVERNTDRAITLLKEALTINPNYVDARFQLGRCYLSKNLYRESIAEFERVLELSPKHPTAEYQIRLAEEWMKKQIPVAGSGER